ncbi:hypothetical protein L218DRAFT_952661 [Marasmius fiardii PR-910]|nr:hypothetical protein L218DRAFT_952661 [Marasmius fiardii PR-910]
MFESLRRPDEPDDDPIECEHPERWRRGQQLPSLPPRPSRWNPINPLEPPPFPWECQLNPALTLLDPVTHTPTIEWSVTHPNEIIFFYTGPNGRSCPMRQPDFLQPATYPFVSHMYLNGLAYASDIDGWWARDYALPWPVTVICREHNEGIVLDDVLHGVHSNFRKNVSQAEFMAWPDEVKTGAMQAYSQRMEQEARIFQRDTASSRWYRRSDYLGLDLYLYGLRPNSNFEGWTLLMGPRPPQ